MKSTSIIAIAAAILLAPMTALADPDKDESGHGKRRHGHREHKEEYWDGNCKVERKFKKDGEYKEERKCKGHDHYRPGHAYAPAPVYVPAPAYAPTQAGEPGVVIQGTIRMR